MFWVYQEFIFFVLLSRYYSMEIPQFVHLSVAGYFGDFQFGDIMCRAATNIPV